MMKKYILLIFSLFLVLLTSCNKETISAEITIESITPARTSAFVVLEVNDPNEEIVENSIVARVFYKDSLYSTFNATFDKDKEITTVELKNLSIDYEYTISIHATINKKSHKFDTKTFKTSIIGSSKDNPKPINTIEDFKEIEKDASAYYRLEEDLDFAGSEYVSLFQTTAFQGHFDGNDKTIKNFTIKTRKTYLGLFARNRGTIANLNIDNAEIRLTSTALYSQYISLVSGRNEGTIDNVHLTNSKIITAFSYTGVSHIGGLSGYNDSDAVIKNSSVQIDFEINATSRTEFSLGGLAGTMASAIIENSHADVEIVLNNADTADIGGAVGRSSSLSAKRSYLKQVSANLDLTVKTEVTAITYNEVIEVSLGGLIGKASDTKIDEAAVVANINVEKLTHSVSTQSKRDTYAIGGLAGTIASNSALENILAETKITLGGSEETNIDRFDFIYLGGLIGQSYYSYHDTLFALNPELNILTNDGVMIIKASPLIGNEERARTSEYAYFDSVLKLDQIEYENKKVILEKTRVVTEVDDEPVITYEDNITIEELQPRGLEDYFTSEYILEKLNEK